MRKLTSLFIVLFMGLFLSVACADEPDNPDLIETDEKIVLNELSTDVEEQTQSEILPEGTELAVSYEQIITESEDQPPGTFYSHVPIRTSNDYIIYKPIPNEKLTKLRKYAMVDQLE